MALLFIPAIAARVQDRVAPVVLLVAVYEKVAPLQIAAELLGLDKTGVGFTRTVTFWTWLQPAAVKV
jgi:hypothetical protein